jgi:hypothetical protein
MFGTWVTKKGARVYELISQGRTIKEISEEMGIPMGSMAGYMDRARKFGVTGAKRSLKVIATDSNGNEHKFNSMKEIKANLFSYSSVRTACLDGKIYCGMTWRFGNDYGRRVKWRGRMVTSRSARFFEACVSSDMVYGDITRIGAGCGMSQDSALSAYRKLCSWGFARPLQGDYKLIGKSDRLGIVEFDSISEAELAGFSADSIRKCFRGKRKKHAGYKWERVANAEDSSEVGR